MCQGHSPFKMGLWEILGNEFEFGFLYVGFLYKGAKCAPGESSWELCSSTEGRLSNAWGLPQCPLGWVAKWSEQRLGARIGFASY